MKKALFSLFFILFLLTPALADYSVDSVSVSAEVSTDGRTQVSMTAQLTFDTSMTEVTIPLPESDVSSVSITNYRCSVRNTDDGVDLVVKNRGGFIGTQTFLVSYRVPRGSDSSEEMDPYSLGLLSPRWARPIKSCTFQVVLPGSQAPVAEDFTLEPTISGGYDSSLDPAETGLTVSDNLITGGVTDRMAYDALSLNLELPEGYFYVVRSTLPVVSMTFLSAGMLLLLLLAAVYWYLTIRTPRAESVPRLLMPEGILVCQLPLVLDGYTCDVPAMLLEWANLGYLSLSVGRSGRVILTKTMAMGSERSRAEQKLFARIFGGKVRVAVTPGRFSAAAARFRVSARKSFRRVGYDRQGGNLLLVQTPCRLSLAAAIGFLSYQALPEEPGFIVLAVFLGFLGLIYSLYLHNALISLFARRQVTAFSAILWGMLLGLLAAGLLFGAFLEMLVGTISCIFSARVSATGPRRSQRGIDAMTQARGLRTFYRQVAWTRLQILLGENARFFQTQLPSAVALQVSGTFAKRFEDLAVPVPEWLDIPQRGATSAAALEKQISLMLRQLRECFR